MRSMSFLIALPLFAIAGPVVAQDVVFVSGTGKAPAISALTDSDDFAGDGFSRDNLATDPDEQANINEMADQMADPAMQDGVAAAVETMASAIMRMPVGQFAQAVETARPGTLRKRIRRDATVADLAGRDARALPETLGQGSRQAMGMMSGFARAMAVMMPEFERMGRDMEDSFKAAKAEARRNRN